MGSGSGRAPKGFHLLEALNSCRDLFERFGGHAQAVGFQLHSSKLDELRERINQYSISSLGPEPLQRYLNVDAEIRLSDINEVVYHQVQRLSPFGAENPSPLFVARHLKVVADPRILKGKHLKFRVEQDGVAIDALAWNMAGCLPAIRKSKRVLSLVFELSENFQPGFKILQLVVRDICPN